MKKILICNVLLLCSVNLLKAQDENEQVYDNIEATEQFQEEPQYVNDMDSAYLPESTDVVPVYEVDTFMPVRKTFIRRANIIFKDRDRLKYENARLRAELAELNKDITKKNKQVKELTEHVNNQTFALNDAKKIANQKIEEAEQLQMQVDQLNDDLARAKRAKIGWTIGGVVVGIGVGVLVMLLVK